MTFFMLSFNDVQRLALAANTRFDSFTMLKLLLRSALWFVFILGSASTHAATRLIVNTVDKGITGQAQIVISGDRIRLTHSSLPRQEMLFVVSDQLVLLINHPRKEITRIDPDALKESVGQLAGIADQLQAQRQNLPEEKREQLDAMLQSLGIENPDEIGASTFQIKALGQSHRVAGTACDWWQVRRNDTLVSRTCLTDNDQLAIDVSDYRALQALAGYVQELQVSASALMSSLGFTLPPLGLLDSSRVPIRIDNVAGNYSAELLAVDHLDAALTLGIPGGYRILDMTGY